MLISHKYKFIFIHVYKNAGSSIMNSLMPFCIPSWQLIVNLHWRERRQESINRLFGRLAPSLNPHPLGKHSTAIEIEKYLGAETYRKYFSFAFVRNPWDWQVSLYNYMLREPRHFQHAIVRELGNFENYLNWRCEPGNFPLQRDMITGADGKVLVNTVGRYETIDEDFRDICARIGVKASLPRLNVSNTKPYREYYNEETRELVRKFSQADIELFGYKF